MAQRAKKGLQFLPQREMPEASPLGAPVELGVGDILRLTREKQGKELQSVANQLRIRLAYLQAIEEGRYKDLPGSTYAVGFVRSYGDYLGLDGADIVRRFREEVARIHGRTRLIFPAITGDVAIPPAAILMLSVLILGIAYVGWYYFSSSDQAEVPVVQTVPDRLIGMPEGSAGSGLPSQNEPGAETAAAEDASPGAESAPAESTASAPPEATGPLFDRLSGTLTAETGATGDAPPAAVASAAGAALPDATETPIPADNLAAAPIDGADAGSSGATPVQPAGVDPAGASAAESPAPADAAAPDGAQSGVGGIPLAPSLPEGIDTGPAAPQQTAVLPAGPRIRIDARMDTWIKIVDARGRTVFNRVLTAGESYAVPEEPGLSMITGNAGGMDIVVDGVPVPPLGEPGKVRRDVALDPEKLKAGTAIPQ